MQYKQNKSRQRDGKVEMRKKETNRGGTNKSPAPPKCQPRHGPLSLNLARAQPFLEPSVPSLCSSIRAISDFLRENAANGRDPESDQKDSLNGEGL